MMATGDMLPSKAWCILLQLVAAPTQYSECFAIVFARTVHYCTVCSRAAPFVLHADDEQGRKVYGKYDWKKR